MCNASRPSRACPRPEPATCRCREPRVDKARPRLCYECGLPVDAAAGLREQWKERSDGD